MKKKVLVSSALGLMIIGTGTASFAATYQDDLNAKGTGVIEFEEGDEPGIVDPTDPTNPVDPIDPVNPATGDLRIQYVSDFDFGKQKRNLNGLKVNSNLVEVKEKPAAEGEEGKLIKVVPFVSTLDLRAERNTGWNLTVKASQFETADKVAIKGGEVTLSNANYAGTDNHKPVVGTEFSKKEGVALIPGTQFEIASADASKEQGIGSYSLALGKEKDGLTDGVTFSMPAKSTVKLDTKYTATFDWKLTPTLEAE